MTTKCIFNNIRRSSVAGSGSLHTFISVNDCPNNGGKFSGTLIYEKNRDELNEKTSHDENNTSE